jgi:hypothetical protein
VHARACSFAYPACNACAPYCDVICGPSGSTTFFRHYLVNFALLGGKVIEYKMYVLIFSTIFVYNISCCKKNLARYCHKCEKVFM